MEIYRKNSAVQTKEEAEQLLSDMDAFLNNAQIGSIPPRLDAQLMKIWNNGDRLDWEWKYESLQEETQRIAREDAEAAELVKLQSDIEYFKNIKIRPWRNQKLYEWIDITYIQGKKYEGMTPAEIAERDTLYSELCDWPDLFEEYKTDEEIEDLKPSPPSWINE